MQGARGRSYRLDGVFFHRAAVVAIAEALMIYRTLDAAMIESIIASSPERARRGRLDGGFGKRDCFCCRIGRLGPNVMQCG
jgi:hypothetical protein